MKYLTNHVNVITIQITIKMRNLIRKADFVAAFALATGYGVYSSQEEVELSELALANVEALAQGETSEEFTGKTCCIAVWDNTNCSGCDGYTYSYAIRQ